MKTIKTLTKLTFAFCLVLGTINAQYYSNYDYNSLYNSSSSYNYYKPSIAGNGDIKGWDNDGDGRRETVFVRSYYKSDGTYVRSHYRAKPKRSYGW